MTLIVHTARISYGGPDRFDVTRKSGGRYGTLFAPSWALLGPYLGKLRAGALIEADWLTYVATYTAEMRESYAEHRAEWNAMLAQETVTLVCYCTKATRCHCTVLAGILVKLGAEYKGERLER